MPLPGPLRQPWTLGALFAPALGAMCASLLVGCAPETADQEADEVTLEAPEQSLGVDPLERGSQASSGDSADSEPSDDGDAEASYADVEGPFLLELGAVSGGLAIEVQLARVLVHVDDDVIALAVTDDWIAVDHATSRWSGAWEGELPLGAVSRIELTLAGEARVDGELWPIPGAWRDLFLDVPFASGEGMPLVVLTGLIDAELDDDGVAPWLERAVLRQVDADGTPGPYGAAAPEDGSR